MAKAIERTTSDGMHLGWVVFCPGCQTGHAFDPRWTFNGDQERPTFTPSMLVRTGPKAGADGLALPGAKDQVCHSFVTDGQIRFLDDCTHELRGQTVPLGEFS